jgi:hypothetical protein
LLKLLVRVMPLFRRDPRKFGRNQDIDLLQILSWETPVHARIDIRPYLEVKQRASACHISQGGGQQFLGWLPGIVRRRWLGYESFMQGYPEPKPGSQVREDLFDT